MSQQLSIGAMIKRISGLEGTKDVTEWEDTFIASIVAKTANGERTTGLTAKQAEITQSIHDKHFA